MAANFEDAFERVKQLAADFKANEKFYLSPQYQEAEARRDFIDKFLLALGWDVNHDTQKNPYEQEVKVERKEHGVSQRRADYAFYLAPNFRDVKFYIEAKKPFGDIATPDNYFQTIRYGWNSQTPIAALFDFEQFEIVDCRFKPDLETALQRNLKKFHFSQYADEKVFAEIYWLFSREAVAGGSLEKYAESLPKKRGAAQRGPFKGGYQDIDDAFLEELDAHRDRLAHIFKNSNPKLDGESLTEATQRTLDRLVFIRFLEDKLIEPQYLVSKFGERGSAWGDFIAASRRLDGIYNGIVFKKNDILDSPTFKVDDDQFGEICEQLSHINSPYDFNAIPIHILGSIYERFLGKVIVATDKRAKVEEKPEVRKAGGVYYTPEYIVRYIVENTVGKLIEGKSPAQIAEMRFADIACGSGSFLLGVYDLLLRYHTKFYNENPGKAKKGDVMPREDGLHLSLQKKREILVNNLYGVDIDNQAVEVAQLSLYLKLLQDETPGSARQYFLDFEQQALLPTLNKNIVCGNSLIGRDLVAADFFENGDTERKLNPMNFEDAFPEIMKRGGFDAVVGNPPYIAMLQLVKTQTTDTKDYWKRKFKTASGAYDIYILFVEQAVSLLKQKGFLGYIIPNKFLAAEYALEFRKWILEQCSLESLLDLSRVKVWTAGVYPVVTVLMKGASTAKNNTEVLSAFGKELHKFRKIGSVPVSQLRKIPDNLWSFITQEGAEVLLKVMQNATSLEEIAEVCGASTVAEGSDYPRLLIESGKGKQPANHARFIVSGSVVRFATVWESEPILFTHNNYTKPLIALKSPMPERRINQARSPKIIICKVGLEPRAYPDLSGEYVGAYTTYILNPKHSLKFLTGLINSTLMRFVYRRLYDALAMSGGYLRFQPPQIRRLPICNLDLKKPADKARHDKLVSLVEQMLAAKPQLARAQSDKDKDFYANKCAALDRQIDALVYELYALTPEEIKIVEGATA